MSCAFLKNCGCASHHCPATALLSGQGHGVACAGEQTGALSKIQGNAFDFNWHRTFSRLHSPYCMHLWKKDKNMSPFLQREFGGDEEMLGWHNPPRLSSDLFPSIFFMFMHVIQSATMTYAICVALASRFRVELGCCVCDTVSTLLARRLMEVWVIWLFSLVWYRDNVREDFIVVPSILAPTVQRGVLLSARSNQKVLLLKPGIYRCILSSWYTWIVVQSKNCLQSSSVQHNR